MAAGRKPLVVWINGAFGVGKTAVGLELLHLLPGAILFDPEGVGTLLRSVVPADERTDDFQDIPAWCDITRAGVVSLAQTRKGAIVVPMTVVDDGYFDETVGEVRRSGVRVIHVSLVAPMAVITERLRDRSSEELWALNQIERCVDALADDRFGVHLNAEHEAPAQLAAQIARLVEAVV